jgi:uncharacterized protein (DUF2225 family)/CRP-like cAMP-binding protein
MAMRNIDFEALRSLRDRHGAAFPRGRVVCREGDTTSEFYVVLQGSVEVSQKDKATGEKRILFTVPAGGFFGEMSCFSGLPRSATCIAAEDSVLLYFNQDTAIQLLRASPRFALGVIQSLCDRLRNANERIARLEESGATPAPPVQTAATQPTAAKQALATMASNAAVAAAAAGRDVPPPEYNRAFLWGKLTQCPVSGTKFTALNVRPDVAKVKTRDSDFREVYEGANPGWYLVYVCPECLFAAYPDDFNNLPAPEIAAINNTIVQRKEIAAAHDLNGERSVEAAMAAYRLAVHCYSLRGPNHQRMGGLYQRLAWLCREVGDTQTEQRYLAEALLAFRSALEQPKPSEPEAELMLLYTVGEINLRLGNPVEAVKTFAQASQHAEFKKQPEIQRLTRDRWTEARGMARPRA